MKHTEVLRKKMDILTKAHLRLVRTEASRSSLRSFEKQDAVTHFWLGLPLLARCPLARFGQVVIAATRPVLDKPRASGSWATLPLSKICGYWQ